nr:hypothetical protein [Tanacetum cinerariifolium]
MPNIDIPQGMDTCGSPKRQDTMGGTSAQTRSERVLEQPSEPPLPEGYTPGSDEGRLKLEELMVLCTTLANRVTTLEKKILTTKAVYHKTFITLTKRVKKLKTQLKQKRSKAIIHSLNEEEPSETVETSKDDDDATLAETLLNIRRSSAKDKGKGIIVWDQVYTFVPKDSKIEKEVMKRAGFDLQQRSSKKQRLDQQIEETEETEEEVEAQGDSDQEIEEMKLYMRIIPDEYISIDVIPLATKPLVIIEYKIVKEGKISTYLTVRADGSTKRYTSMINLLDNIDREDLETLWKLVQDKHGDTRPEEGYERVL